jgi:protein-ribulosamine 3-kinase
MFPQNLKIHLEKKLGDQMANTTYINRAIPIKELSSIHQVYRLETNNGFYILKLNYMQYSGIFEQENYGLKLLSRYLITQNVVTYGSYLTYSYIILDWVEEDFWTRKKWFECGMELGYMHKHSQNDYYGLECDNFIGKSKQLNTKSEKWENFYRDFRLRPNVEFAKNNLLLNFETVDKFTKLYSILHKLISPEEPVLLHGDMWGGNQINTKNGIVFNNPSPYFGHREIELSLTYLFKQFPIDFYEGYESQYPLSTDWKERIDLYSLYPLLINLYLDKISYNDEISRILNYYTKRIKY